MSVLLYHVAGENLESDIVSLFDDRLNPWWPLLHNTPNTAIFFLTIIVSVVLYHVAGENLESDIVSLFDDRLNPWWPLLHNTPNTAIFIYFFPSYFSILIRTT